MAPVPPALVEAVDALVGHVDTMRSEMVVLVRERDAARHLLAMSTKREGVLSRSLKELKRSAMEGAFPATSTAHVADGGGSGSSDGSGGSGPLSGGLRESHHHQSLREYHNPLVSNRPESMRGKSEGLKRAAALGKWREVGNHGTRGAEVIRGGLSLGSRRQLPDLESEGSGLMEATAQLEAELESIVEDLSHFAPVVHPHASMHPPMHARGRRRHGHR